MRRFVLLVILTLPAVAACATTGGTPTRKSLPSEVGIASYYAHRHHGLRTASGQTHDEGELSGAHRTLPFGTRVRVTNLRNGRDVVVTITDRGPFVRGRILDVSRRAARELGFLQQGVTRVRIEVLARKTPDAEDDPERD